MVGLESKHLTLVSFSFLNECFLVFVCLVLRENQRMTCRSTAYCQYTDIQVLVQCKATGNPGGPTTSNQPPPKRTRSFTRSVCKPVVSGCTQNLLNWSHNYTDLLIWTLKWNSNGATNVTFGKLVNTKIPGCWARILGPAFPICSWPFSKFSTSENWSFQT